MQSMRVATQLIKNHTLLRAMICANDQMALGVLTALNNNGVRVPEDVIVTGFDGIDETDSSDPRLTTVKQPMMSLGRQAIRLIVNMIHGKNNETASKTSSEVLPVTVLLRESCEGPFHSSFSPVIHQ